MTRLGYRRIADGINVRIAGPVIDLIDNQFVFHEFWYSSDAAAARAEFESCRNEARSWLEQIAQDTRYGSLRWAEDKLLEHVFCGLFVLRNQLMHGSATESGFMNSRQVECGARILEVLVPTFLEIMLDNPHEDWGRVPYAVSEENRERWHPEAGVG